MPLMDGFEMSHHINRLINTEYYLYAGIISVSSNDSFIDNIIKY